MVAKRLLPLALNVVVVIIVLAFTELAFAYSTKTTLAFTCVEETFNIELTIATLAFVTSLTVTVFPVERYSVSPS
jgi:hypothetical protein